MSSPCPPPDASLPPGGPCRPDWLRELEALAEAGDLAALLEWFTTAPPWAYELRQLDGVLRRAVDQAVRRSRRFADQVYRQTLGFVAYLLLRLQACTVHAVAAADGRPNPPRDQLPAAVLEKLLPPFERLARLANELSQGRASTARHWQLARRGDRRQRRRGPGVRRSADPLQELFDEDAHGRGRNGKGGGM